jgi:hypothetical protein
MKKLTIRTLVALMAVNALSMGAFAQDAGKPAEAAVTTGQKSNGDLAKICTAGTNRNTGGAGAAAGGNANGTGTTSGNGQ